MLSEKSRKRMEDIMDEVEYLHEAIKPKRNELQKWGDWFGKMNTLIMIVVIADCILTLFGYSIFTTSQGWQMIFFQLTMCVLAIWLGWMGHKQWIRELHSNADILEERMRQYRVDQLSKRNYD